MNTNQFIQEQCLFVGCAQLQLDFTIEAPVLAQWYSRRADETLASSSVMLATDCMHNEDESSVSGRNSVSWFECKRNIGRFR